MTEHSSAGPVTIERATELVLANAQPLKSEPVPLREALGRTLAVDVASVDSVPGFDNSAMDGFAVRAADTGSASRGSPVTLAVVGESRAGHPAAVSVPAGGAIRISTGAVLPAGADAVVRIEDCGEPGETVDIYAEVEPGKEIRRAGEDIRAGEQVLTSGTVIGPAELGVLASVGAAQVTCTRQARVRVLATGDELVEPGAPLERGQIRNSNAYSVPAQAGLVGAQVNRVDIVPDDYRATVEAIGQGLLDDLLVICGGVSVGEHDHVKAALRELGVTEVFWGVELRPGHPTWFGFRDRVPDGDRSSEGDGSSEAPGRTLVFGLPGNPVSAMVTFHLFARPALTVLAGGVHDPLRATATMDERYRKRPGRAHVVRCRLETRDDGFHVRPTKEQGSHVLTSMLGAEALALIETERGDVEPGERVEIELL